MREANTLANTLEQIEERITADRALSVKGFGILLLGKKFADIVEAQKRRVMDPTELITSGIGIVLPDR